MNESLPPFPPPPSTPLPPPPSYQTAKRKSRWWMPVAIIFGVFAFGIIAVIAIVAAIGSSISNEFASGFSSGEKEEVKSNSVLYISLKEPLNEYDRGQGFSFGSSSESMSFLDAVLAVKRAKEDENIRGIYLTDGSGSMGMTKASELLETIQDFKSSGKFVYAYLESANKADYYLSLAADSIFMPAEGFMIMEAAGVSAMFYKNMLEKVGVDFYVQQFEDYKSAGESFSRTKFSDSAKYELREIIEQRADGFIDAVSRYRKVNKAEAYRDINEGLYLADSMLKRGWIDALASDEQVRDMMLKRIENDKKSVEDNDEDTDGGSENDENGEESSHSKKKKKNTLRLTSLRSYCNSESSGYRTPEMEKDKKIAIIYGVGGIRTGKSNNSPFNQDMEIASTSFIKDLISAREDDDVKAIILRIDSPGGSALASDLIWEEIQKTKKIKPVYASMSDVAASGGYYIPMACDTIIAHPYTITGSIGVIGMLPSFAGTLDKMGITMDTISTGKSSHFLSPYFPHTPADKAKFAQLMSPIYTRFVTKAAKSRGKSFEEMRALAKGRVWTGADAHKRGLVDMLGGLDVAIATAKNRIGVEKGKKVQLSIYPKKKDGFQAIMEALGFDNKEEEGKINAERELQSMLGESVVNAALGKSGLPAEMQAPLRQSLRFVQASAHEPVQLTLPYSLIFR